MTDSEREVREMLRRRADDVAPSPDGLERIRSKLATAPSAPSRRAPLLAVAALVAVAMVSVGLAVSQQRGDETTVAVGDDTTSATTYDPPMTTTTAVDATSRPAGVWPWPGDAYDEAALLDPVDTAEAYVTSTVGMSQSTTVSAFRPVGGDGGYVDFGGDLQTTVSVARIGDRWHVESASSDLISAHADTDGSITFVAEQDGEVVEWIGAAAETQGQSSDARGVEAGEEVARLEPSPEPRRARLLLATDEPAPDGEFSVAGLAEVRAPEATFAKHEVPLDAVWSSGGADVSEVAEAYVVDRFGDGERVLFGQRIDDTHHEVTTGEQDISLRLHLGRWYVVAATSETVALRMSDYDGAVVRGEIVVTRASRLTIQLWTRAGELAEERIESASAGTVPYSFELAGEPAAIVRVTALTDESETYLAEAAIVNA